MSSLSALNRHRRGSTLLEVQISFMVFVVGVSGLVPLAVINSRLAKKLNDRVPANATHYLTPVTNAWAAKLGAPAVVSFDPPPAKTTSPTPPAVTLMDNQGAGFLFDKPQNWLKVSSASAFGGDYLIGLNVASRGKASWAFSNLESCKHEVFVTYRPASYLLTNTPFAVYDGSTKLQTINLNQRLAPTGSVYQGVTWQSLGKFKPTNGILRLELSDSIVGLVAADAARVVPLKNVLEVVSMEQKPETQSITVKVSLTLP